MIKNWIIRTRTNHILGPVSKEKLIELIEEGAVHADDEVCSGNGYWFFIKENDLVNKYIYNGESQSFNPVSEALNEMRIREKNKRVKEAERLDPHDRTSTKVISVQELFNSEESE